MNNSRTLAVFDNIPDLVMLIDPKDYRIVDANNTFLKKEGVSKKDVIGKSCYAITHKRSSPCCGPNDACPLKKTIKTHHLCQRPP